MRDRGRSLRSNGVAHSGGLLAFMLVLAGCGGSSSSSSSGGEELQKLGKGEGQLNLISWAGYVEPAWSKPFEQQTGCVVHDKAGGTPQTKWCR